MTIDYGRGLTNIDHETGIRCGIISGNLIDLEDFEYNYDIVCPDCCSTLEEFPEEDDDGLLRCPKCEYETFSPDDFCPEEPSSITYEQNGYAISYSPDTNEVWVFKSPWKALANHASPCAPGAVTFPADDGDAYGYALPKEFYYNEEDMTEELTLVKGGDIKNNS